MVKSEASGDPSPAAWPCGKLTRRGGAGNDPTNEMPNYKCLQVSYIISI